MNSFLYYVYTKQTFISVIISASGTQKKTRENNDRYEMAAPSSTLKESSNL